MAARTSSLVHPEYKTHYSVKNWSEHEQGLRVRGDVTLWLSEQAIASWRYRGRRKRGGQWRYSDLAIETALTLRLLFHLPLRQTEGFVGSLLRPALVHECLLPLKISGPRLSVKRQYLKERINGSPHVQPGTPEIQDQVLSEELV